MEHQALVPNASQLTYDSYLKVPDLLNLQQLQSDPPQHDETLFIIIHQVYELWFKQILHEVHGMFVYIDDDRHLPFIKSLKRVNRILDILVHQIDVLETMTPIEFDRFRSLLNPASGFQSHQFRVAEYSLGIRDDGYLKFHETNPVAYKALKDAIEQASLWDRVLAFFSRKDIEVPDEVLQRDVTQPWEMSPALAKTFAGIYRDIEEHANAYAMLESLLDLDQKLLLWRYRHVAMVERIIGITRGTGGTHGVEYLSRTMSKRAFPEIWEARQHIITNLGCPA
jgi:tryptophan 2,3-dioxygenase